MFTLAHLSDLHITLRKKPRLPELLNKRILGYLNWRLSRAKEHSDQILNSLISDMLAQTPNHIAITGDLVNLALPDEYEVACQWLERIGSPQLVSLVPGNHDVYHRSYLKNGFASWNAYMESDPESGHHSVWPYVRKRGSVLLIGVSSALPTGPWMATGTISAEQLALIPTLLEKGQEEGLFRIILIHHPPFSGITKQRARLTNGTQFLKIIQESGAELLLHGHTHTEALNWIQGSEGAIPAIGTPSASAQRHTAHVPGQYNLLHISGEPGFWECHLEVRGFKPFTDSINTLYKTIITPRRCE